MDNQGEIYTKSVAQKRKVSRSICVDMQLKKITLLRAIQKIRKKTLCKSDVKLKALRYAHQLKKRYKTPLCRL